MLVLVLVGDSNAAPPGTARGAVLMLPQVMLIVHGYEFATQRVPLFLRTALSSRSTPINFHVICDVPGCHGFLEAWDSHVVAPSLELPGDTLSLIREGSGADASYDNVGGRELPLEAMEYLKTIHPLCKVRGYGYLFLKLFAAELLPHVDRLIILDPDSAVLGDLGDLWREFDQFDRHQVLSMAVDQSDRYYYRLQDANDELYSAGWAGVPHAVGVNGGVILLYCSRARQHRLAAALAALTHVGASERDKVSNARPSTAHTACTCLAGLRGAMTRPPIPSSAPAG